MPQPRFEKNEAAARLPAPLQSAASHTRMPCAATGVPAPQLFDLKYTLGAAGAHPSAPSEVDVQQFFFNTPLWWRARTNLHRSGKIHSLHLRGSGADTWPCTFQACSSASMSPACSSSKAESALQWKNELEEREEAEEIRLSVAESEPQPSLTDGKGKAPAPTEDATPSVLAIDSAFTVLCSST
jgi:hypothetical protein